MKKVVLWGASALALLLASPLLQADPDKDESGHGKGKHEKHGKHHDHGEDYYERDGRSREVVRYEVRETRYIEERYVRGGPPPWAPAHGYRRKHKEAKYRYDDSYETRAYEESPRIVTQVGLDRGSCNHEQIGTILGGIAGGVIGNQAVRNEQDKAVATVAGVLIGAVVGNSVGRSMDRNDTLCTGQALERVADNQSVTWRHQDGMQYEVTPQRTFNRDGLFCREYAVHTAYSGRRDEKVETACRAPDGSWSPMR